jgi:hypothetical protein
VKTREWHHINGQLAEIGIELTRETETGGNTRHYSRYEMIEVTIGGVGELEGTEADLIEGFIINTEGGIRVLHELVNGEGSIVGLNDRVGDLRGLNKPHY